MNRPFLVMEDTSIASRRTLFRLFGVTWAATRYAWLSPLAWCAMGMAVAAAERGQGGMSHHLAIGLGYGLLLYASNVLHTLGHITAGRLVGAPMAVNLLTSTRDLNLYAQPGASAPTPRRLARSLGGPLANLVGALAAFAATPVLEAYWLSMAGLFNLAVGLWTLVPIPSLDGWVVWRSLLHRDP